MIFQYDIETLYKLALRFETNDFWPERVDLLIHAREEVYENLLGLLRGKYVVVPKLHRPVVDPVHLDRYELATKAAVVLGGAVDWPGSWWELMEAPQNVPQGTIGEVLQSMRGTRAQVGVGLCHYLAKNPAAVPKDWEGKRVFFFGETYYPVSPGEPDFRDEMVPSLVYTGSAEDWKMEMIPTAFSWNERSNRVILPK